MPRVDDIRIRHGTAAEWAASTDVLNLGEPVLEWDTGRTKHGDGIHVFADLPYSAPDADPLTTLLGNPINAAELGRLSGINSNVQDQLDAKAAQSHNHTGVYSPVSHNHSGVYSPVTHNHSGVYASVVHNHDSAYAVKSLEGDVSAIEGDIAASVGTGALVRQSIIGGGGGGFAGVYIATDFGLTGNGTTDDTAAFQALIDTLAAAGGGTIYFPPGDYLIAGVLQDTSGANAQIVLPSILDTGAAAVVISLVGALSPPTQFFGDPSILPSGVKGFSVIKTTLTGGTGTASVIAGKVPAGSTIFNNVVVNTRDLIFQGVPNPTFRMLNLESTTGCYIERTLIHAGRLGQNISQPLHDNSYGIILPPVSHSARSKVDGLQVWGYYWGIRSGELTDGSASVWSCTQGIELRFAYHPSIFTMLGLYGCANGIVCDDPTGPVYLRVLLCDIEHSNNGSYQDGAADVYDPANVIHGDMKWLAVKSGVGNIHTLVKTGGTNFITSELA